MTQVDQSLDRERLLDGVLDEHGRSWLADAVRRVREREEAVLELFPVAARACGRAPVPGMPGVTADLLVRERLLAALPGRGAALGDLLWRIYRYGDASERIAVLTALGRLDADGALGEHGLQIVRDAIRTNDTRLIEAAVGPYGARHLPDGEYRQAVLKCVFVGVPLSAVAGLKRRADRELARMLADYAHERTVAGRDVPADVWPLIRRHPDVTEGRRLPEGQV
ncbi:EboA domain-containing protein [Thermomonospora amylolytica]|uniref:EboA domain-containing protein n=1 Tax=Thermomonospora amylolytica TaxID=1411117 RepID=UPI000E6D0F9B|nr:EboA domain-containing protein [Thermomonospora amylolytica]